MVLPVGVVVVVVVEVAAVVGVVRVTDRGLRELNTDLPHHVLVDLKHGDIDDHLRARLVEVVDQLLRQQQFIRSGAHDDGVLAGNAVDLGVGEHIAQRGRDVVQVVLLRGVREIEGLHRLLVQLGPLRRVLAATKIVLAVIGRQKVPEMVPMMRSAS